jgi:hypothetical protein
VRSPVATLRIPAAARGRGELEIRFETTPQPARWRRRLALFLIRLAGRLAALRVRVAISGETEVDH